MSDRILRAVPDVSTPDPDDWVVDSEASIVSSGNNAEQVLPWAAAQPERLAVLPLWLTNAGHRREALRWSLDYSRYAGAFHAVRLPVYAARLLVCAPRGASRVVVAWWRWAFDAEGRPLREHTVRAEDPASYLRLGRMRADRIRHRLVGSAVLACLCAIVSAIAVFVWPHWLAAAALVTLLALGWLGRRLDRPILDVAVLHRGPVRLTADVILRAFVAAGLCKEDRPLSFASPVHRDGAGWAVRLDLPFGVTADRAVKRRAEVASGLDVLPGQVFMTPERGATGSARRVELWVADRDPTTVPAGASPLLSTARVNYWQPWPLGVDERGTEVAVCLLWLSLLVGGLPRSGKSFVARTFALAAALDPDVRLLVWDLKGSPDWTPFRHVAHELHQGEDPDPDTGGEPLARLLEVVRDLRAEVGRRNRTLRTLPPEVAPEGKLTEQLARSRHMDMPLVLLVIDEVHRAFAHKTYGPQLAEELADLVRTAPSVGVMVVCGTQRPDKDATPPQFRDNHSARFALRVGSWNVSDLVLGAGAYSEGLDASRLPETARGVGLLRGTGEVALRGGVVRTYLIDSTGAERICVRGRRLREAAGTLAGMALGERPAVEAGPVRSLLADLIEVFGDADRLHSETLCARLAESWGERYGGWGPEQLAAALRPHRLRTVQVWGNSEAGTKVNRKGLLRADLLAAAGDTP